MVNISKNDHLALFLFTYFIIVKKSSEHDFAVPMFAVMTVCLTEMQSTFAGLVNASSSHRS